MSETSRRQHVVPEGEDQGPAAGEHPRERPRDVRGRGFSGGAPDHGAARGRARASASPTCTCSASAARPRSRPRCSPRPSACSRWAASASAPTRSTSAPPTRRGVPVFNAPFSNTRSVAEMMIAEIIMLARQLGDRSREVHQGKWRKVATGCFEVRGKTLGIVGYGHIGRQVGVLAEAHGHARDLLRPHDQAADGQQPRVRHAGASCWPRPTS